MGSGTDVYAIAKVLIFFANHNEYSRQSMSQEDVYASTKVIIFCKTQFPQILYKLYSNFNDKSLKVEKHQVQLTLQYFKDHANKFVKLIAKINIYFQNEARNRKSKNMICVLYVFVQYLLDFL